MKRPWLYGRNRTLWLACFFLLITMAALLSYCLWTPGKIVTDGRHDRRMNGIWLDHNWLGGNTWLAGNHRASTDLRSKERMRVLSVTLSRYGIIDLFPCLCPCDPDGQIVEIDHDQTRLFLKETEAFRVMPWVGGVLGKEVFPDSPWWRKNFIGSIVALFEAHPEFAGIHIYVEPMPSGNRNFIKLLKELRASLPEGKILSIAAYPPPTVWHPFSARRWDKAYFEEVSRLADQVVIMMYGTSIYLEKVYQYQLSTWTQELLSRDRGTELLLGLPVCGGVSRHKWHVENLKNALIGIHAGLDIYSKPQGQYRGIAIYSEREMDRDDWTYLARHFSRP